MEDFLEKPLVFIDLETTGTSVSTDRIAQIALVKVVNGEKEIFQSYVNPTAPMSLEAIEVTGLKDDFLRDYPLFKDMAKEVDVFMEGCDIGGHNIMRFDLPLLVEEFLRAGITNFPRPGTLFVDTRAVMEKIMPRTLEFCFEYLTGEQINKEAAHDAYYDADLSARVYQEQIKQYGQTLGQNRRDINSISTYNKTIVDFAGKLTVNDKGLIVYAFGKNIDKRVTSDMNYMSWMLKGDFTQDTKRWINYCIKNHDDYYAQFKE